MDRCEFFTDESITLGTKVMVILYFAVVRCIAVRSILVLIGGISELEAVPLLWFVVVVKGGTVVGRVTRMLGTFFMLAVQHSSTNSDVVDL